MALLFMDSFQHYATADLLTKWNSTGSSNGGSVAIVPTGGRRGTGSFRYLVPNFGGGYVSKAFPAAQTVILGVAFNANWTPSDYCPMIAFRDGSTPQVTMRLNNSGTLTFTRWWSNQTVLGTTPAIPLGAFTYIEIKVKIHDTTGTLEVRFNGNPTPVLNLTGLNTRASSNNLVDSLYLGASEGNSNGSGVASRYTDFADLYLLNDSGGTPWNNFLGDVRTDTRKVIAAGASSGWTTGPTPGGTNYQMVDDATPNADTDYIETLAGATDLYEVEDAPVAGGTIYGIQMCWSMKKTDAGSCIVAPVVRQGTTPLAGPTQNPGTEYVYHTQIHATNPHTGLAWAESDFNANQYGLVRS